MSKHEISRKQLINLGLGVLGTAFVAQACGSDGGGGTGGAGGSTGAGGSASGSGGNTGAGGSASGSGGSTGAGGAQGVDAGRDSGGGTGGVSGGDGGTAACGAAVNAAISDNHGHALMLPLAHIMAGTQRCYDVTGTATHPHYITITAADFTTLRGGGVVRKSSCNGGDHEYVLSCAAGAPAPVAPNCTANPNLGSTACA